MGEGPVTVRARYSKARRYAAIAAATVVGAGLAVGTTVAGANAAPSTVSQTQTSAASSWTYTSGTATPIKHVVVIFDENVSFDHYFGTYPYATNTDGSTFHAKPGTPTVNGLYTSITSSGPTGPLLTDNPNVDNGVRYNPTRLTHSQALTCDQDHAYTPEQEAVNGGKMDKFIQFTNTPTCTGTPTTPYGAPGLVMDYYDGNTVTGLWNYAQNYALSDNNFDTMFGPSTPGALNLISGQTGYSYAVQPTTTGPTTTKITTPIPGTVSALNGAGLGSIYGDLDPAYDDCSDNSHTLSSGTTTLSPLGVATGQNIGDLLNARHITWGWFQGGFAPTGTNTAGFAVCGSQPQEHRRQHGGRLLAAPRAVPVLQVHRQPEAPAAQLRGHGRPHRPGQPPVRPVLASPRPLKDGNMPAVSFLKAAAYQDGHPGYSDPLDEQTFLVNTINQIEQSKYWKSTAIVITWDDSDGWYDHQVMPVVNGSNTTADTAFCSTAADQAGQLPEPLRLRPAAAHAGHLALDPAELRQP